MASRETPAASPELTAFALNAIVPVPENLAMLVDAFGRFGTVTRPSSCAASRERISPLLLAARQ
jgi:hypothetical protein